VGLSCAGVPTQPLPRTGQATGIALGLEAFATLADGTPLATPRIFRVGELPVKRAQRRVARRVKGRRRRRKAAHLLARAHRTVRRARQDFHPKTALGLVRPSDPLSHEAVQPANLLKNHQLAKSISDAGWSGFLPILAAKAAYAGKRAVAVPPAFTSHACSGCGMRVHTGLSVRWHACPECGTRLHRDQNAALNILRLGQNSAAGQAVQARTGAGGPRVA
jgi:putative transposase